MIRDLGGETKTVVAIGPVSSSGSPTTIKGTAIDRLGYNDSVFAFVRGEGTADNVFTFAGKIQESDTTTDGDFADMVPASAIVSMTYDSDIEAIATIRVDLRSKKRYIRAVSTVTMTGSLLIAATCTLGKADVIPAV